MKLTPAMMKQAAAYFGAQGGKIGGKATTKRKQRASAANGELGGRPMKYGKCPRYKYHRFNPGSDRCPCGFTR
jgi:hypothetical protein